MKQWGLNEIREAYLKFFESKGHLRLPSFSLVPQNDPSILLINAGMTPMKPFFTGAETPPSVRVTTCQKCIRTIDIDNVGLTDRHGTFFEMLGNFSFGDYFKEDIIPWAWELCTQVYGMDPNLLYPSVYEDDDEAVAIWQRCPGLDPTHIKRLGKETNFWEHGVGPCGPCSEIYYDRGPAFGCDDPQCDVGCECDRYIEIWNLVFTQFNREEDGSYKPLKQRNIDTGGGLERFAAVLQNVTSIFEVDTVKAILAKVCELTKVEYGNSYKTDCAIRIITDHIRSASMMIADGVRPANDGRGYVLKRLLRRAARYGRLLGLKQNFLAEVAKVVVEQSGNAYPELRERQNVLLQVIDDEETRFLRTLNQGLSLLETKLGELKTSGNNVLSGDIVFNLHDTFGFPFDLTRELATEQGFSVDEDGFKRAMQAQKDNARQALKQKSESAWAGNALPDEAKCLSQTEFVGYETLTIKTKPLMLIKSTGDAEMTKTSTMVIGEVGLLLVPLTPFYAEGGGQVGDIGIIKSINGTASVNGVSKNSQGLYIHEIEVIEGEINASDECELVVDAVRRSNVERNHTATHLLHKALRKHLGLHVEQAGSLVNESGLRFDFSHGKPLTEQEITAVENEVNEAIMASYEVKTALMSPAEAQAQGAMALFGEKYGEVVRVLSVADYSIELCGGTHVKNTAQIGMFTLTTEAGIAAGVRRIEAKTGRGAIALAKAETMLLTNLCDKLKAQPADLEAKIEQLQNELKQTQKELLLMAQKDVITKAKTWVPAEIEGTPFKLILQTVNGVEAELLRTLGDSLKERYKEAIVLLGSILAPDKVVWLAMCSKEAIKAGVKAGDIVREAAKMTGGGGGGRPDMAQAGGKDTTKVQAVLEQTKSNLIKTLKG